MTRPHIDRLDDVGTENGAYSLKVGRRVPDSGVNLAYVSSPSISLNDNISLIDQTGDILENTVAQNSDSERMMVSNANFMLLDSYGRGDIETGNVFVTDEFSIYKSKASDVKPLYYAMKLPGRFYTDDAKNLVKYIAGYNPDPIDLNRDIDYSNDAILYTGSKISITKADGSAISSDKAVKIKLVAIVDPELDSRDVNKVFDVYLYTNFKNGNGNTYVVQYPSYNIATRSIIDTTNIMNAVPIFEKKDIAYVRNILDNQTSDNIQESVFAVVDNRDYYNIYAPCKMITATEKSRPAIEFRYRVLANLKATYDEYNPHTVKIGVVYQASQPIGEDISDVLCGDLGLPSYVTKQNPHPMGNYYTYDPRHWKVDLNMPKEYFLDYDIIVMTGYGTTDLSLYSEKFHYFLDNGGKLIVDNLSNDSVGRLKININDATYTIMDIGCDSVGDPIAGTLQAGTDTSVFNEYHLMDSTEFNNIRYSEEGVLVSPEIVFGANDSVNNWTTVLTYSDGKPSMLYKKYNNRGLIYFSNCGFLRKYRSGKLNTDAAHFVTNIVMKCARDYYVTTPWLYDNVYHRDNLFKHEYVLDGRTVYINDVASYDSNTIVAKKVLASTTRSAMIPYIPSNLYSAVGSFFVMYECGANIQMTSNIGNDGSQMLYVYAIDPQPYSFTPLEFGYRESDIKIENDPVEFNYTIKAYTYVWGVDGEGHPEFIEIAGPEKNYTTVVSRADGVVNLGPLTSLLPPLLKGENWADTSRIFFKLSFTEHINRAVPLYDSKVNIGIYDKRLGQYYYNNNAESVIPYNDLYRYRSIVTGQTAGGDDIVTQGVVANDLVIQAWTNHYTISAKARTFSVKLQDNNGRIYLELPTYTDERERWSVKIHNGGFNKTRYTMDDYIKYVQLMKYRYGPDTPEAMISSLEVFPSKSFEYSTKAQFELQPFDGPMPVRKSIDEKAGFVNEFCIGVNGKPLYVRNFTVSGEPLIQVGARSYKAVNGAWVALEDVTVMGESSTDVWVEVEPDKYTVDYKVGIIDFLEDNTYLSIKASYTCMNMQVLRRKYANQIIRAELLKRQSDSRTLICSHRNIAAYPSPKLFKVEDGQVITYSKETYVIDYRNGVINTIDVISGDLYFDYTYYEDEQLIPVDYDIENSLIYLSDQIDFTDEIYVTYMYEEQFVQYSGYYDGSIYHHLDLNPSEGHMLTYSSVDADGNVVYGLTPSSKVINKAIYLYLLPYKTTDLLTNAVQYNSNNIRHCFGEEEMARIKFITPEAIVLGMVQIKENSKVEDSIVLDTRVRGGGLKVRFTKQDIEKTQPLSSYYWDISTWDGIAYQSNGVTTIRLPKRVLREYGGRMTNSEVQTLVDKHAAFGTYQIIEYYDEE